MSRSLILLCGLLACDGGHALDSAGQDLDEGGWPDLRVDPSEVDFGEVWVSEGIAVQTLEICNDGSTDLHVMDTALEDQDGPFEVYAIPFAVLPAGMCTELELSYLPRTDGQDSTWLLIDSNDPGSPHRVRLYGTGVAPAIELWPEATELGTHLVRTRAEVTVAISSGGNRGLLRGPDRILPSRRHKSECPMVRTLEPRINDIATSTGWSFVPDDNTIHRDESGIPDPARRSSPHACGAGGCE